MNSRVIEALTAIERIRSTRLLVYISDDRSSMKSIDEEDVPVLYECLRALGPVKRLDLLLHTGGGRVNIARKIALLLRAFAQEVHILIPYKARSAGTLLCLSAQQIVMSSMAELSPLDPQIMSGSDGQRAGPQAISTESIRSYRRMAEEWFDLRDAEHRMRLFSLLSERIFPASLSTFFRADRQMRQIADELLRYQLGQSDGERRRIVDKLVSGYEAHDYCITRAEARDIGLQVVDASDQEETLLWTLLQACYEHFTMSTCLPEQDTVANSTDGVIMTTACTAVHVTSMIVRQPGDRTTADTSASPSLMPVLPHWTIRNHA